MVVVVVVVVDDGGENPETTTEEEEAAASFFFATVPSSRRWRSRTRDSTIEAIARDGGFAIVRGWVENGVASAS